MELNNPLTIYVPMVSIGSSFFVNQFYTIGLRKGTGMETFSRLWHRTVTIEVPRRPSEHEAHTLSLG